MSAITDVVAQTEIKPQVEKISGASTKLVKLVIEESVVVKVRPLQQHWPTTCSPLRNRAPYPTPLLLATFNCSLEVRHGGRRAGR